MAEPVTKHGSGTTASPRKRATNSRWHRVAALRRFVFLALVLATTGSGVALLVSVLPYHGARPLEVVILVLFSMLFGWVTIGFWLSLYGFVLRRFGGDPCSPLQRHSAQERTEQPLKPTAILFPIYHEEVERSFAGLRATYLSLARAGALDSFQFFILSDSRDPDFWLEEQRAWHGLCESLGAHGRIHYRRRTVNVKRKPGNVLDFLRRWGQDFDYMVVLDADSVMSGETLVQLVQLMEGSPNIGILQTAPQLVNAGTFYARMQQFGSQLFGPLFLSGLAALQLGDSVFWGHNAILRVRPFMQHCGIPQLRGWGLFRGSVLSHDFVEAALLGRQGWETWLEPGLGGSYEESPPTLVDELSRDRRWVKGNLQHLAFLFGRGFRGAHRLAFVNGMMNYLTAMLWLLFIIATSTETAVLTLNPIEYFPAQHQLFPEWPEWHPDLALALLASTFALLLTPKLLALLDLSLDSVRRTAMGGFGRAGISLAIETLFSALLAPIRMLSHSLYVFEALFNVEVRWAGQNRTGETRWRDAWRRQAAGSLLALAWSGFALWVEPLFFLWSLPIALPLVFAAPISVLVSRYRVGQVLRRRGLLLSPEETHPSEELSDLSDYCLPVIRGLSPVARTVLDPRRMQLQLALVRPRSETPLRSRTRRALIDRCCHQGPDALSAREQRWIVEDRQALERLHTLAWRQGPNTPWGKRIDALVAAPELAPVAASARTETNA